MVSSQLSAQQVKPEITEPTILSLHPAGGSPGKTVEAVIRGNFLAGAYSVWFETGDFSGRVQKVEELKEAPPQPAPGDPKPKTKFLPLYGITVNVDIASTVPPGTYLMRLVTPQGLSNGVPFRVLAEPVVAEASAPHADTKNAQEVRPPTFIFARLATPGELDYYKFHATRGQTLTIEISGAQNFDPRLALYRRGGSWFDADRPSRVLFDEERDSDLMLAATRETLRVPDGGDYFLEVSSLFGKGSPESTYRLRIAPGSMPAGSRSESDLVARDWTERSFGRNLQESWIQGLAARGVIGAENAAASKGSATGQATGAAVADQGAAKEGSTLSTRPEIVRETEPDDAAAQAQSVSLPAILEGTIEHPGDVDSVRFKVEPGQKLAFEIETPATAPPIFNPRLGVVDADDHEFFSNVDRRLSMFNNNADPHVFLKAISSKSTYSFERGGEYVLQVRDITSRYGSPDFRYSILIRQQVPHVGEIAVADADQINLKRGEPRKLAITAQFEEGFAGDVSFSVDGLPPGVSAYPALQYEDGRAPLEVAQNPEIVLPKGQKAAIVLVAAPDAALTQQPVVVSLRCRPIAKGQLGSNLLVRSLPLMIVADLPKAKAEAEK